MAVQYRTQGLILKKQDQQEADQVFTVFTEDFGKIRVKARSIRKIKSKLRSGIDLFYFSKIEFVQGRNVKTLTNAQAIEKFKNIRKSLKKTETAQKIAELTDKLIKGEQQDQKILNLLKDSLERLNTRESKIEWYYFFWSLVSLLGYKIDFHHCVKCHRKLTPSSIHFSPTGLICCSKKDFPISLEAIKILRLIGSKKQNILQKLKLEEKHLQELEKITNHYLRHISSVV